MNHKFPYIWNLADTKFTKDKGTVFSCFACGGGSSYGYKLAGFDVIGCNEIDPRVNKVYVANHHPKYNYLMDVRELVKKARARELPEELYHLDILDGSPPCSSFTLAGQREDGWGTEKKFREGQAVQVLDTLFFDFIELARILRPKIVIAENVKGLVQGNARNYLGKILHGFYDAGYGVYYEVLDASKMGVPQKRERIFFAAVRHDMQRHVPGCGLFGEPYLNLRFNEEPIPLREVTDYMGAPMVGNTLKYWQDRKYGDIHLSDILKRAGKKASYFNDVLVYQDKPCCTLTTQNKLYHYDKPVRLSEQEILKVSSWPQDYDFGKQRPAYICGMSVPPVMMAQIASRVYDEWLSKMI